MRREGWQSLFWSVIEDSLTKPFTWGEHDCVTFAMACVDAILTESVSEGVFREFGEWSSEQDAALATGADLDACVRRILGEPVPWPLLGQGDVALAIDEADREFICVHDGCQFISPAASGLQRVPFLHVQHGWRIQ